MTEWLTFNVVVGNFSVVQGSLAYIGYVMYLLVAGWISTVLPPSATSPKRLIPKGSKPKHSNHYTGRGQPTGVLPPNAERRIPRFINSSSKVLDVIVYPGLILDLSLPKPTFYKLGFPEAHTMPRLRKKNGSKVFF